MSKGKESQLGQDEWVLKMLSGKKNGTFLDIGCSDPNIISNTSMLEREYDWTGIGIDIKLSHKDWKKERPNTVIYKHDALTIDYIKILEDNRFPTVVDYLSMDLEPPELTLECLYKIPFNKYKFRTITFETDRYNDAAARQRDPLIFNHFPKGNDINSRTHKSREYLTNLGYMFVKEVNTQDDYYVYASLCQPGTLELERFTSPINPLDPLGRTSHEIRRISKSN